MLDSVVLNMQWKRSLVDAMHHIGVERTFAHKKPKEARAQPAEVFFRRYCTELLVAGGQSAAALKSFAEM